MEPLNVPIDMRGQRCLVVGGGPLAARRAKAALRAGAQVTVIAPVLEEALQDPYADGRIEWRARPFAVDAIDGFPLVFALTGSPELDDRIAQETAARGGLCSTEEASIDSPLSASADAPLGPGRPSRGHVWLVGAGPGDPNLLTLHGLRALQQAEAVLHDRLVPQEMLDLAPASAQRVFVGKRRSRHYYSQDDLNALMVDLALAGKRVVRLKGGDPFLFGRGGEEAAALAAASIDHCVIPGVTAGSGCTAYAGIPLTHRDHAHACQFITAHDKDGECHHEWAALVQPRQTLVVYMGLLALRSLFPKLVEHGMDPETPAALIEKGTTPEQRVLVGTVRTLPEIAAADDPVSPAVVIVGHVVRLRETLGDCGPTSERPGANAMRGEP